jgi:hypothetical protein
MRILRLTICVIILTVGLAITPALGASHYTVRSSGISLDLSRDGRIVGAVLGNNKIKWNALGETALSGCRVNGKVESDQAEDGKVRFKKRLLCDVGGTQREIHLIEEFISTKDSVRWEITVDGQGSPWTTPIKTHIHIANPETKKFWTTWGDPRPDADPEVGWVDDPSWQDPLVPTQFLNRMLWYGAPYYQYGRPRVDQIMPFRDVFCIPLATVIDEKNDTGLSLALSPEDTTLEMTMQVSANGDVTFSRLFRRILEGKPVHYSMDLIAHEGDWRGGMRWMTARYADFFNPPLASAARLGGTAAYSSDEGALDVAKMRRMAFTVNWKACFDYPYQGLFIPPVADNQEWYRGIPISDSPHINLGPTTSIPRMADYSRRMRDMGFDVLNYFDAAEFGTQIVVPPPPPKRQPNDPDLWKDPNDYLYAKLADAIIYRPKNERLSAKAKGIYDPYYRAYRNNIVLDWGEPCWQNFLLDQARRLIEKIPDSAGICFDRLDFLRLYNFKKDDGVTWYDGPARSMITSWIGLMEKLGPIEHGAGQAIFVNNLVSRIDTMRQVDGLFDEMGHWGGSLNGTALLAVSKPAIGWVLSKEILLDLAEKRGKDSAQGLGWAFGEESPQGAGDAALQKFLYMGVFPMAPFPQNDHSLLPGDRADRIYMDYGPLFTAMRERKWVLLPHAISVKGEVAKANLFKVPEGYIIPVVMGGSAPNATVTISGIAEIQAGKAIRCELLYPGNTEWKACEFAKDSNSITVAVPLQRGCAMIRLRVE